MCRKPEPDRESERAIPVCSKGRSTDPPETTGDRKDRTLKNKEELPLNLDRGPTPTRPGFATEPSPTEGMFRQEPTGPAPRDQPALQRYLEQTLKLVVNQTKSRVRGAEGCEFLGFMFVGGQRATIKVAPKKLQAFKRRIRKLTGRSRGISMKQRLTELRRYVRGWVGYFALAKQVEDFLNLDGWIRRRLRMCYWKQWRYARTKVAKLRKLGVNLDMAIKHAVSRKGYWRMSRTPAMRYAMPNKWLAEQGLLSLAQLWYERAPLRGTA